MNINHRLVPINTWFEHEQDLPAISVCIPVSNRAHTLPITLKSINCNSYPRNKIILIFYDGSSDSSSRILNKFIESNGSYYLQIIYERENSKHNGNIAKARNGCFNLARKTKTDYVISIDSDVEIPKGAFEDLVSLAMEEPNLGLASIPYAYLQNKTVDNQTFEVDITMGCTIISRKLLEMIDWRIDERFARADDLWLGAKAEKLGFRVTCLRQKRATHLRQLVYRTHFIKRFTEVPMYHFLLLKDGILTRRLKRTYAYYGAYLLFFALCLYNPLFLMFLAVLLGLGFFHYKSVKKFLYTLPVGIVMTLGFIKSALITVILSRD